MNIKFIPLSLFFFISFEIFSQVAVPFSVRRQIYVKGDMTMIANNIVNRQEFLKTPNTPYNKIDSKTKLNDELICSILTLILIKQHFHLAVQN